MKIFASAAVVVLLAMVIPLHGREALASPDKAMPPIAVQLWSVREDVARDFAGTLRALAEMGFAGVEFAGDFGPYQDDPVGLRTFLDELGLQVAGTHIGLDQLDGTNFDDTVAFYAALDCDLLVIPMDRRAWNPDAIDALAGDLARLAARLEPHGMRIGYHNHAQEMAPYGDATYWDYLAQHTPANVVLQQDVGWTTVAGADPVAYVNRYPGRTVSTHYKAKLPRGHTGDARPIIGQDTIDWPALVEANRTLGGTEWLIVEQEDYPDGLPPLEAVRQSKLGLDDVLAGMASR